MPRVKIALFLPHVGVFGGVRRFLELGNSWTASGHAVMLFHPGGERPAWLGFAGEVRKLEAARHQRSDLAISADPHTFDAFRRHESARHLYYCVLERDPGFALALRDRELLLAANSGPLRRALAARARRPVLDGIGGIRLEQFHPAPEQRADRPLRVLLNGRRSREKKGTDLILASLEAVRRSVPEFETVLFDSLGPGNAQDPREGARLPSSARFVINPSQDQLVRLYQSCHVFVAAERKAGWCNTALEAMACGAAVVCTPSGTTDFARDGDNALMVRVRHAWFLSRALRRVLGDPELRARLSSRAPLGLERWSWDRLAEKLLSQLPAEGAAGGAQR